MQALPLGQLGSTPWSFSPLWFLALALIVPALVWLGLAWRRALLECPNRIRRAGVKEMRRLLKALHRTDTPPGPAHLHAWLRATARVWDVRTSAPCISEVSQAAHALTGDATVSSRWRELWLRTEHGLYAPNGEPSREWLQNASTAAATVDMPKRERVFPNRLGHWLPSILGAVLLIALITPRSFADVPWSAPPVNNPAEPTLSESDHEEAAPNEPLSPDVGLAARAALDANWNDWAAHHNLAAVQTQQGELNRAIAHATAAFVQHPRSAATREVLRTALGDTQSVDPGLRRLLSGAWYERAPAFLSPAGWQRLALLAAFVVAAGLTLLVISLYSSPAPRVLLWAGRSSAAFGALLLVGSIAAWNAYGPLNQGDAAMLLQNANLSPVPTDLVPVEETSPLVAGAVVQTKRTFLSWREVSGAREVSGWVRSSAVMPLYASP